MTILQNYQLAAVLRSKFELFRWYILFIDALKILIILTINFKLAVVSYVQSSNMRLIFGNDLSLTNRIFDLNRYRLPN